MDHKLTDTEVDVLRRCREDIVYVGALSCAITGRQLDAVRRLFREGLVEWRSNEARTGYGYATSEAGREVLAALKAQGR